LIGDDADRLDRPRLLEKLPQVFFCSLEGEIADEELCRHRETSCRDQDRVELSSPAH
jgi:hypothetical protein